MGVCVYFCVCVCPQKKKYNLSFKEFSWNAAHLPCRWAQMAAARFLSPGSASKGAQRKMEGLSEGDQKVVSYRL